MKDILPMLPSFITAVVAVLGIFVSYMTVSITRKEKAAQREDARSERFTRAIEHLKDDALAIRMGALFELKKLGLASPEDQADILRILAPYIRDHIERRDDFRSSAKYEGTLRAEEDVYVAGKVASLLDKQTEYRLSLNYLDAKNIYLSKITLVNAKLSHANFSGAILRKVNLRGADLNQANLQKANLVGADLRQAENLTATQLLEAIIDDTTLLDDDLRAEYESLKAKIDAAKKEA